MKPAIIRFLLFGRLGVEFNNNLYLGGGKKEGGGLCVRNADALPAISVGGKSIMGSVPGA